MTLPRPSCTHPASQTRRLFPARDYLTHDSFEIIQCDACGLALTSPPPDAAAMEKYYPSVYYAGTGGRRFPWPIEQLQQWLYGRRVRQIEDLLTPPAGVAEKRRVLDVGCGPGFLLREFQRRGWDAHGTELSEKSAAHARQLLGLPVHVGDLASARFPDDHFDAVVLWHVLEHVRSPSATLAEVARVLRPGGVCLVGVPNFGSWEARCATDKWFHLDVPRHLNHFTVPALTAILAANALAVQGRSFLAPEYDSFSFLQTTLNRLGIQHNLLYGLLRQGRSQVFKNASLGSLLATVLLALPLGLLSLPAPLLAALLAQGSTVSLYALKPLSP